MKYFILFVIMIILYQVFRKFGNKKVIKENLSKADFAKEKDYYRDILKKYSPAELSFVDDYIVRFPREIVATILNLQIKKKIDIVDNKIVILDDNIEDLKKSEQYIMCGIKDGKFYYGRRQYIKEVAEYEAEKDELVKLVDEETKKKRYLKVKIIILLIDLFATFFMLYRSTCLTIPDTYVVKDLNDVNEIPIIMQHIDALENPSKEEIIVTSLFNMSMLTWIIVMIGSAIYDIGYRESMAYAYCRTEKGEEINIKLEGLRDFLKDYTLMDTRERESILVWNEYLIYSLILGINKTDIVEDIMKVIEM